MIMTRSSSNLYLRGNTLECFTLLSTSFVLLLGAKGAVPEPPPIHISLTVVHENPEGVIMTWNSSLFRDISPSCVLQYSPILEGASPSSMGIAPSPSLLTVNDLKESVNYSAHVTCQLGKVVYPSNLVYFTPRGRRRKETLAKEEREKIVSKTKPRLSSERHQQKSNSTIIERISISKVKQSNSVTHTSQTSSKFESNSTKSTLPERHSTISTSTEPDYKILSISGDESRSLERAYGESPPVRNTNVRPQSEERPPNDIFMERGRSLNPPQKTEQKDDQQRKKDVIVVVKQRHIDSLRRDPHRSKPSSSVILGAVCGVVGFLIINVTVVMVVRQYSLRRARRRQFLDMQLQQNDGYIFNVDEFINA